MTTKSHHLEFYYLDSKSAAGSLAEEDMPYISIQFDIDASSPRKLNTMVKNAERQLQFLLKTTGVKDDFHLNSLLGRSSNETFEQGDSLLNFVRDHSDEAREKAKHVIDLERSIDIMYTFFFMEHKIRVLFEDPELTTEKKKTTLQTLEKALHSVSPRVAIDRLVETIFYEKDKESTKKRRKVSDFHFTDEEVDDEGDQHIGFGKRVQNASPEQKEKMFEPYGMFKDKDSWKGWDKIKAGYITPETTKKEDDSHIALRLEGMSILFTNTSKIDVEGRLLLNIDKPDTWTTALTTFKPSEVVANIQACKSRKNLEVEVANLLGVGCIYTDYSEQNSQRYVDYLNAIKNAPQESFTNTVMLNDINLRVVCPTANKNIDGFTIDEQTLYGIGSAIKVNYEGRISL
eukprot:gene1475-1713_t